MVISLVINLGELVKVVLKRRGGKRSGCVGEDVWGLLGFVALECVWVYFCCCSGGCVFQGLQGSLVVHSWYSRLVSRW
jgi:hypothetical protein